MVTHIPDYQSSPDACVGDTQLWIGPGGANGMDPTWNASMDCAGECGGTAVEDCTGQCGGSAIVDECGICNGIGVTCTGCTDPNAINYNIDANNDFDGLLCEYPSDLYPNLLYDSNNDNILDTSYVDCLGDCLFDNDNDLICNEIDNCPNDFNPNQEDFNSDDIGDVCDGIGIYEHEQPKKVIKIVDILGREINTNNKKITLIHIYDDGSIEKVITMD